MKKYLDDFRISGREQLTEAHVLLKLTCDARPLPDIVPGQFVNVRVENSAETFLRRPISINRVDRERNEIWLLVHIVGAGTKALSQLSNGDKLNILYPLGNGFSLPTCKKEESSVLLVGGGVGTAPLLFLGEVLKDRGDVPAFLLGARSKADLLQLDEFKAIGGVFITTEDGTCGEKGFVTQHSVLQRRHFTGIYTCGPKPMMMSVARYAKSRSINCEASLENVMACGLGACLCCVEKDVDGHNLRVCQDGPVFNVNRLPWQI